MAKSDPGEPLTRPPDELIEALNATAEIDDDAFVRLLWTMSLPHLAWFASTHHYEVRGDRIQEWPDPTGIHARQVLEVRTTLRVAESAERTARLATAATVVLAVVALAQLLFIAFS